MLTSRSGSEIFFMPPLWNSCLPCIGLLLIGCCVVKMLPAQESEPQARRRLGKFIEYTARDETPSTVCSESDEESSMGSSENMVKDGNPSLVGGIHPVLFGFNSSASIVADNFTKGPFRFPEVHRGIETCTPVCMVCQNELVKGQSCRELLACGHCFHATCLEEYLAHRSRCPVCHVRCKPAKTKKKERATGRPYWSPDFDTQLLSWSDKLDRERRLKLYLLKGTRDNAPRSYVFLKSGLPTLLEESAESLETDDGTMISLCCSIARERQLQKLRNMACWTKDMKRLAITFAFSLLRLYIEQAIFVDLFQKRLRAFSNPKTEKRIAD